MDAEVFDIRLRLTSKFLLFQLLLVKGKLSVWGFERCENSESPAMLYGSYTVDHLQGMPPVLKVCYFRYCSQLAEIDL